MAETRIICEGLGKRYGALWALRHIDLSFMKGEVVMLIGPNASGKTTLIKSLLGLVHPSEGRVTLEGTVIDARAQAPPPEYRRRIGYMPQISQFPPALSIAQLLEMMADVVGLSADQLDDRLIAELGLAHQLDKRLSALSGGTRQKVSAVLAFRTTPTILVMDEPTAGLDPLSAERVLRKAGALRDRGGTVLITSHLMGEVEALADRVAYLEDGGLRFLLPVQQILESTCSTRLAQALPRLLGNAVDLRPQD
ncbi:MAG TPA: ABC transporter ATP-binding protein [Flavobacteriales bacterium]|jgi:Cu-processing system ATP-binding protein|nr:ABC transporter ATP-binding protein [Flavobacteriales bacterium]HOY29434.1 ABC transporter ATP-binding protein [Flavobacteriales bacterium]